MVLSLAPTWMISGYVRSLQALGASADKETLQDSALHLAQVWAGPGRIFHNLKHVTEVLSAVDQMADSARDPEMVRVAAWYHGVVFNTDLDKVYAGQGGEDPAASAQVCAQDLTRLGVEPAVVDQIVNMLQALAEHRPGTQEVNWMVLSDADLAVLATDPQSYREYRTQVREEYPQVPPVDFLRSRIKILEKLLARPQIYYSTFAQSWEEGARENLSAELEVLRSELAAATANSAATTAVAGVSAPTNGADNAAAADAAVAAAALAEAAVQLPAQPNSEGESVSVPATVPSGMVVLQPGALADTPGPGEHDGVYSSMEALDIPTPNVAPSPSDAPPPSVGAKATAEEVAEKPLPTAQQLVEGADLEDEEDFNPYAQADQADLVCSMENCEELFDTLAMNKVKLKEAQ